MTTYFIKTVFHSTAGIAVSVLTDETAADFLVSEELWPLGRVKPGDKITEDQFSELEHSALLSRALARTKEILYYSPHSRAGLLQKLRHHGMPDEIAEEAADWAVRRGLIREEEQALLAAETYHRRKYWGRKRIAAELIHRGYEHGIVQAAVESVPDEEYLSALIMIIEKKFKEVPTDPAERQKMVLSLLRIGYTGGEIKDAIARVAQKEESLV